MRTTGLRIGEAAEIPTSKVDAGLDLVLLEIKSILASMEIKAKGERFRIISSENGVAKIGMIRPYGTVRCGLEAGDMLTVSRAEGKLDCDIIEIVEELGETDFTVENFREHQKQGA